MNTIIFGQFSMIRLRARKVLKIRKGNSKCNNICSYPRAHCSRLHGVELIKSPFHFFCHKLEIAVSVSATTLCCPNFLLLAHNSCLSKNLGFWWCVFTYFIEVSTDTVKWYLFKLFWQIWKKNEIFCAEEEERKRDSQESVRFHCAVTRSTVTTLDDHFITNQIQWYCVLLLLLFSSMATMC